MTTVATGTVTRRLRINGVVIRAAYTSALGTVNQNVAP